jgi:hypothetical protein
MVGNVVPESFFEDFQDQAFEDSPSFFVEVELHVRSKRSANLLLGLLELIIFSLRIP